MFTILLPGSFNPPTLGHLKLIERVSHLCDTLHVGIGHNLKKTERLLTIEETLTLLKKETSHLRNVTVSAFQGLTVEYAKEIGAKMIARGLRNSLDFERERQMAEVNQQLTGIETLFLASHPDSREISSTLIRELAYNGASLAKFLPKSIAEAITRRNK